MRGISKMVFNRWLCVVGTVWILVAASPAWAQEVTLDATQQLTVDATKAAPKLLDVGMETYQQLGMPTGFTVQELIGYAIMFIVLGGLTYVGKRWSNLKTFTDAVGVTASRVYIKNKDGGDDGDLSSAEMRKAGYEMLLAMGGVVAKEALKRGPEYVEAMLHDDSNLKKQAANLANK
jgi:hypothetical protein